MIKMMLGIVAVVVSSPALLLGFAWRLCWWSFQIGRGCADWLFLERKKR